MRDEERPRYTGGMTDEKNKRNPGPYVERPAPLAGYRELTQDELNLVNYLKEMEYRVGAVWAEVKLHPDHDPRCAAHAKLQLQDGFMWLVRAITRPRDVFDEANVQNAAEGRSRPQLPVQEGP